MVIGVTGGVWTSNQFLYKPGMGARGEVEKNFYDSGLNLVDARLAKEVWVGDPQYGSTLQTAVAGIGSNNVTLRIPAGTQNISANLSIPANITLKPERGAVLAIATDKTLTINGGLDAGLYQVFSCAGTGMVTFKSVPWVYPEWWGAVGNGTTDDSAALNSAATSVRGVYGTVNLTALPGYAAASQIDFRNISVKNQARTRIFTSYAGAAVLIGWNTSGTSIPLDITLYVLRSTDWTSGNIGIRAMNVSASTMNLQSTGSEIGIQFYATAVGGVAGSICYNNITLGAVKYNKTGVQVYVADAISWANDNLVIGGNIGNTIAGGEYGISLIGYSGGYKPSKWVFQKPCIEYVNAGFLYAFKFDRAEANVAYYPRNESTGGKIALMTNASNNNIIHMHGVIEGRSSTNLDFDEDPAPGGSLDYCFGNDVKSDSFETTLRRVWDFTSFGYAYHDGTYLHVPGFQIFGARVYAGTVGSKLNVGSDITLKDGNGGKPILSFANAHYGVGVAIKFVDLGPGAFAGNKRLYVRSPVFTSAAPPFILITCWDGNGAQLTGTTPYYLQGPNYRYDATGGYYTVNLSNPLTSIRFNSAVAKVHIGIGTDLGVTPSVEGIEILAPFSVDAFMDYTGPREIPGRLYAAAAPTKWHFQVGQLVNNSAATTGVPSGWVCTKRTETTLSVNGSGGDTTITVASSTGIASGDIIGVKLNTGLYHFTTVNGAPSGSIVTLTAALPGSGVVATSGNAVVANLWRAMANL
jgi:hypothetical protein